MQQPNNPTFLARVYGIGLGYGITGAANERKDGVNVRSDAFSRSVALSVSLVLNGITTLMRRSSITCRWGRSF